MRKSTLLLSTLAAVTNADANLDLVENFDLTKIEKGHIHTSSPKIHIESDSLSNHETISNFRKIVKPHSLEKSLENSLLIEELFNDENNEMSGFAKVSWTRKL